MLKNILSQAGMTAADAARAAGFPTANAIYNFLNGRTSTLSQETYEKLAQVIPGASIASLVGLASAENVAPVVQPLQVRAAAVAGLLQARFDLPTAQQVNLSLPIEPAMHAAGVFGVEVREPGAEKIFKAGTALICMPLANYEGEIVNRMKLILQRIRDSKVEVTVRELELQANEAWLWLRSTHPEHQQPVRMPYTPGKQLQAWRSGEDRYTVAAVVISAYIPNLIPGR